jgi:hypothetical protein
MTGAQATVVFSFWTAPFELGPHSCAGRSLRCKIAVSEPAEGVAPIIERRDMFEHKGERVATSHQELNFIVEHVGLPRIEEAGDRDDAQLVQAASV